MSTYAAVFTILASAVIVLGGIAALTRSIWKAAEDLRANKDETRRNTTALQELKEVMNGRLSTLEQTVDELGTRVSQLERK